MNLNHPRIKIEEGVEEIPKEENYSTEKSFIHATNENYYTKVIKKEIVEDVIEEDSEECFSPVTPEKFNTKSSQDPFSGKLNLDIQPTIRDCLVEKPFQCDTCQKTFSNKGTLSIHIRIHNGEKPFKCKFCEKAFHQKGNLNKHMMISHIGIRRGDDRPYKCDICPKSCTLKGNLAVHMKVHSDKKPFKCTICKMIFCEKENLDIHIRMRDCKKYIKKKYKWQVNEYSKIINYGNDEQSPKKGTFSNSDSQVQIERKTSIINDTNALNIRSNTENEESATWSTDNEIVEDKKEPVLSNIYNCSTASSNNIDNCSTLSKSQMTNLNAFQSLLLKNIVPINNENNIDADKAFLLSILPDFKSLDQSKKTDFRIHVLNFFKNQNLNSASHNSTSTFPTI